MAKKMSATRSKKSKLVSISCTPELKELLLRCIQKDDRGTILMGLKLSIEMYAKTLGILVVEPKTSNQPLMTSSIGVATPVAEVTEPKVGEELIEGKTWDEWWAIDTDPDNPVKWPRWNEKQQKYWRETHPEWVSSKKHNP